MAKNSKSSSWSKNIDIKYLVIRQHVKEDKVMIEHINTKLMIMDPLTKALPPKMCKEHVASIGLIASI